MPKPKERTSIGNPAARKAKRRKGVSFNNSSAGKGPTPSTPIGANIEDKAPFQVFNDNLDLKYQFRLRQPVAFRVFQRQKDGNGQINLQFETPGQDVKYLRARVIDSATERERSSWKAYLVETTTRSVEVAIEAPGGGWYDVEVILYDTNRQILARSTVSQVGVGEIFVVAGQSNSTNCGSVPIQTGSDMVVSTDGQRWQRGNDPQIGTHDFSNCQGGSSWPAAGDALVSKLKVPVAFASTGFSGTAVRDWLPNSSRRLYDFTLQRMKDLGKSGFRAVLWHQGETDVANETTTLTYKQQMQQIIQGMQGEMNWQMPWLIAEAAWCRQIASYNKPAFEIQVTNAQKQLVIENPYAFSGPNTDQFTEQYRSTNCHFNRQGAIATGQAWSESVIAFLRTQGVE